VPDQADRLEVLDIGPFRRANRDVDTVAIDDQSVVSLAAIDHIRDGQTSSSVVQIVENYGVIAGAHGDCLGANGAIGLGYPDNNVTDVLRSVDDRGLEALGRTST